MEVDSADDGVSEVVETFVILEVDVQAILYADLHFHGHHFIDFLYILIWE